MKSENGFRSLSGEEKRALQEWAFSPAPGEDALSAFTPPVLNPKRRAPLRRWLYQAAAAAILFTAGYISGIAKSGAVEQVEPAKQPHPQPPVQLASVTPATVSEPARPSSKEDCPAPQVYQGSDGHFRINTTLCNSGSRATWVINPKLELASAPGSQSEEKQ